MSFRAGGSGGGGVKRSGDQEDSGGGKKTPLEVMQMVIKNSQRDLLNKATSGLPQDPEALTHIFARQQMLLELQSEMMEELVKNESKAKTVPDTPKDKREGPSGDQGGNFRRFNEERHERPSRQGPPEPFMQVDDDNWTQRGMGMGRDGPVGLGKYGSGPMRPGPMGQVPMGPGPMRQGPGTMDPRFMRQGPMGPGLGPMGPRSKDVRPMGPGPFERGPGPFERGPGPFERGPGPFERVPMEFGPMGPGPMEFGSMRKPGRSLSGGWGRSGRPGYRGGSQSRMRDNDVHKENKGRGVPPSRNESWDFLGRPGNPLNRPYDGLPSEDRITILKREIFKYDNFPTPLKVIERARHHYPDAHLRTNYNDEPVRGTEEFTGYFDINGVLMAVERGKNKIDAKVNCYHEALHLLACKPNSYIYSNCARLYGIHDHPSKKAFKNPTFSEERIDWIRKALHEGALSIHKTAPNRDFEEIIYTLNLSITQVIRLSPKGFKTDLYIDDLFVSSGEGIDKITSKDDAFREARGVFVKNQREQFTKIMAKENRLTSLDFFDPDILDIKHSEFKHRVYTNIETLSRKGTYNKDLLKKKDNIIAIVPVDEKSDWKCLDETAAANDLLMEYVENNSGTCARCIVYLQGQCFGDSYSHKEESSRSMAMNNAKYILLKRVTTFIERKNIDLNNVALSYEQIVEAAGELCMSQPELLNNKIKQEYTPNDKDPAPNDLSPWVDEFLLDLICNYVKTDGLDDLIISHLPSYHTKILVDGAAELNIAIEVERHKNVAYTIIMKEITKRLASDEFIDYLKAHGNESGRFKLMFKNHHEACYLAPDKTKESSA